MKVTIDIFRNNLAIEPVITMTVDIKHIEAAIRSVYATWPNAKIFITK